MFPRHLLFSLCFAAARLAQAVTLPDLADFEDGLVASLGGAVQAQGGVTSLDQPSPFSRGKAGLDFRGLLSLEAPSLSLPLAWAGGLDLGAHSPARCLSFDYRTEGPASLELEAVLVLEGAAPLKVRIPGTQGRWAQMNLWLPGAEGAYAFAGKADQPKASALQLRVIGSTGAFRLQLDRVRLDPPSSPLAADAVARAFGVSETQVLAARSLDVPETLAWTLLLLQAKTGASLETLLEERRLKAWGQIAQAHGVDWAALNEELASRAAMAGLQAPQPTRLQVLRALDSNAFSGGRP